MKNRRIFGIFTVAVFSLLLVFGNAVMAGNECPHAKSCTGDKAACQKPCTQKSQDASAKATCDKSKCTADCKGDCKNCTQGSACPKAKDGKACCPQAKDGADAKKCCPQQDNKDCCKAKGDPGKK